MFCSLMCSSDVIAAVSIVSYEDQPKLYSIVFGEGITNDAVSIILFNVITEFEHGQKFTSTTPFSILGKFLLLGFVSIAIGLVVGLLSSYIFKVARYLSHSAIIETSLMFCFAYISYTLSMILGMSGIITLLTTGIVMAHYTWYNLSPQGKHVSSATF